MLFIKIKNLDFFIYRFHIVVKRIEPPNHSGASTDRKEKEISMKPLEAVASAPELAAIADTADHIHVKSVECRKNLREFLAASLSYMPGWMRFLYRVRWVFVRLLGASQDSLPSRPNIDPKDVAFAKGREASFFTVASACEERYWLGEATDKMITGYLGVFAEPLGDGANRFHIVTMVKYRHWTGRIYFAAITPFHHLVVYFMAREAAGGGAKGSLSNEAR